MLSIVGYLLLTLTLFELIGVNLGGLVLGGAITGVVVGIAAQQTLANLFAGIVLIIVRPFVVGDHIVLRSGPLGGEYEGRVTDIGLYYVDVLTAAGPVKLPNAGVLAGAVGPGARAPKDDVVDEESTAPPSEGGAPRG
jgi:small-conductance mechanosensitive channel